DIRFRVREVAVLGAAQLVRGAMLVDQPRDLSRVPRTIGREARRNQQVNRLSGARREIEQPPRRGLCQQLRLRLRPKRDRNLLDVGAAPPQLVDERPHVQFGPAPDERDLRFSDDDSHKSRGVYVAKRKLMISPSLTMYSLPSRRTSPCSRHAAMEPR